MLRRLSAATALCLFVLCMTLPLRADPSWAPGILVMPLQPSPGSAAADAPVGMALQKVIENEVLPDAPTQDFWAHWTYRQLFPTRQQLDDWLAGRTEELPPARDPRYRYLLRGRYRLDGAWLVIRLRLDDRARTATFTREVRVRPSSRDWSPLHRALVDLLREAGVPMSAARAAHMDGRETLSLEGLRLLGQGLTAYMTVFTYGNRYASYDDAAFRRAAVDSPRSYAVQCFLGWTAYRHQAYREATRRFEAALRLYPSGVDALEGLIHATVKLHDPSDTRWALAKARLRGVARDVALADLWTRRAQAYVDEGRNAEARRCFERAFALEPAVAEYAANVAYGIRRTQGCEAAIARLDALQPGFRLARDRDVLDFMRADIEIEWAERLYQAHAYEEASRHYKAALDLSRGRRPTVAAAQLWSLAQCYACLGRYDQAIGMAQEALDLARAERDPVHAANALLVLGAIYRDVGDQTRSAHLCAEAVSLLEGVRDDLEGLKTDWIRLGHAWLDLGRTAQALDCFARGLARAEKKHDREEMLTCRIWQARALEKAGRLDEAASAWTAALSLARALKDAMREGVALYGLGWVDFQQGALDDATTRMQQAGERFATRGDREAEADSLLARALAATRQNRLAAAADLAMRALAGYRAVGLRTMEAVCLVQLMYVWKAAGNAPLAIFHGKLAVDALQAMRGSLARVDRDAQARYVKSREDVYRTLADLLITEGRLIEAQQVVEMLKASEYLDYVRGERAGATTAPATLTSRETALEQRYSAMAGQIASLGAERERILAKGSLTHEDQARLGALDADLAAANAHFISFLQSLANELGTENRKVSEVKEAQSLRGDLRELGPGTVALYTVVGEDRYRVILVSPSVTVAREYPIKRAELRRLVAELRQALRDRREDPRPAAKHLYDVVVGPVEADLRQLGAQTLMWSLDDVLRYVPMAALHDGHGWLVERYRNTVFTPASPAHFNRGTRLPWRVLALGVSRPTVEGFTPLPSVPDELKAVVQAGAGGGRMLLDGDFTLDAFRAALYERFPVVHIASHFQFRAGDKAQSFLLLGAGSMSLADLELMAAFDRVDLLTLSACNTALGDAGGSGAEVEGFAVMAQRQGAHAVLASLWSVSDRSTRELMATFYKLHADQTLTKAEALRRAQLALLKSDDHAHPFYWAPFVLIGDWK